MSYILCDVCDTLSGEWISTKKLTTMTVVLKQDRYTYNYSNLYHTDINDKVFKIMNTKTRKINAIAFTDLLRLVKEGKILGVEEDYNGKFKVHCISPLGYLLSNIIDPLGIDGVAFGNESLDINEQRLLHKIKVIQIPHSSQVPVFYNLRSYHADNQTTHMISSEVFLGDYILYLFAYCQKAMPFLADIQGDVLRLWDFSTSNASRIWQRAYITCRINDMRLFQQYIAQESVRRS